jgi:hypothetical protein
MRTDRYILDEHGQPQPCDDLLEWGRWFETSHAARIVSRDKDEGLGGTEVTVSTVFLALDHQFGNGPPVLWETLVFGGPLDGEMDRYCSLEDAILGHQAMCQRVRAALAGLGQPPSPDAPQGR